MESEWSPEVGTRYRCPWQETWSLLSRYLGFSSVASWCQWIGWFLRRSRGSLLCAPAKLLFHCGAFALILPLGTSSPALYPQPARLAFSPTSQGGPEATSQSKLAKLESVLDSPPATPRKTPAAILLCALTDEEEMVSVIV